MSDFKNLISQKNGIERIIAMPKFSTPFSGKKCDRKLTKEELLRTIRFMVASEYEAIQLYMQAAESTDNENAAKIFREVADDERVHAGCFIKLLFMLDADEKKLYLDGFDEVNEILEQ